jgi:hypothetical protein
MNRDDARRAARELQLLSGGTMDVMFHGLSMDPLLFEGDSVIVQPVDIGDVRIGDVLTYRNDDKYPTRRVVWRGDDHFVLWCDAWPQRRFRADHDAVLGRVVARVRNGHELAATSPEWIGRRERALRSYRRALPGMEARRVVRGLVRRLRSSRRPQ